MFSPSAHSPARNTRFNAYRQVGASTAVDGASPHKLVTLLLDALLGELACARGALARGDVAEKGRAIIHAVRIVEEGLKAPLDLRAGGLLAERLDALYEYVVRRLTHANLHRDDAALQECTQLIGEVRIGWLGIAEQAHRPALAAAA